MMFEDFLNPLLGGVLIGLSASLLLLLKGRVFGVSGILGGLVVPKPGEVAWRLAVLLGLITSGVVLYLINPMLLPTESASPPIRYIFAGLLVGFGTQLGGGCTSGHGVCGLSRFSPRSMVATLTFIGVGILTVAIIRFVGGSL